jgi:voltage-gated potassium channel
MRSFFKLIFGTLRHVLLIDVLRDPDSRPAFAWAGLWILIGVLVYHYFEGWGWIDALYFCVVTLATVGYGDFTPTTPFAKLFTIFYILNGIGILLFMVNKVVEVRQKQLKERANAMRGSTELDADGFTNL